MKAVIMKVDENKKADENFHIIVKINRTEYKFIENSMWLTEEELNALGKSGWQLAHIEYHSQSLTRTYIFYRVLQGVNR